MSSMSMGNTKQVVRPPQRGIFPLDHFRDCKEPMELYLECLEKNNDMHHKCRELSKSYLQCRMDHDLMAKENLEGMGYSEEAQVRGAKEYDLKKEKEGFVAGKHISKDSKWWWQRGGKKDWEG